MSVQEAFETAGAVLLALGGGGAVVTGLSGYLGKVWAERLMAGERHKHERDLAQFRSDLAAQTNAQLEQVRATVDLAKSKLLGAHQDKVMLYRAATDLVAEMITDLAAAQEGARTYTPSDAVERVLRFERDRLRAYGYLAMFAPQRVMDAFDQLIDYLLDILEKKVPFEFNRIRSLGIAMLNEIRADLGIDPGPIAYHGHRQ